MSDTKYAKGLKETSIALDSGDEAKIERIHVKSLKQDEIRFSWWKEGRMMMRPLDLSEEDLLRLLRKAVQEGVFTGNFRTELRAMLSIE